MKNDILLIWERLRLAFLNKRGEMNMDLFDIKDKDDVIGSTKGGKAMKAILYFPKSQSSMLELKQKIATVHAEAIATKLNSLPLPIDKKYQLIDEVMNAVIHPVDSP